MYRYLMADGIRFLHLISGKLFIFRIFQPIRWPKTTLIKNFSRIHDLLWVENTLQRLHYGDLAIVPTVGKEGFFEQSHTMLGRYTAAITFHAIKYVITFIM